MRILVTGGAGYIGSHTANQLIQAGHHVVVFDNLSTGFIESVPKNSVFEKGDVTDAAALSGVMVRHKIEAVIHFAAKLSVAESVSHPTSYYHNNTLGMLNLVQACKDNNIKYVVFSSTAASYGHGVESGLLNETLPTVPINPYGWSKVMSERILTEGGKEYGIKNVILRYFNVAGAALDGKNGQKTANAYHLIHVGSQAAVGKRKQVAIYGTDYPTPDGTCIRDYIHVEDLAQLHVLALNYLVAGGESDVFNCGYGHGFSVREVLTTLRKVSGNEFPIVEEGRRAGDPAILIADSSKIRKAFKWEPKYDNLEVICKSAFDWERSL
ncbi:UDP-glucose 4-epimerase GalE [Bdellovibrio sp. HCB290]|uniref:UDP-glucose 4-epimerase GalE n=1 Tax=Bdellovibrio sp. HCB290 TaxID=3394356 RepID=UPI0039B3D7DB